MKLPIHYVLFSIVSGIIPVAAQPSNLPNANYSPASLAIELRRLDRTLEKDGDLRALAAVPVAWYVEAPERGFAISSEPLRLLLAPQTDPSIRALNREKAAVWLDHLAEYLEGSTVVPVGSRTQEHTALARVLARPEFAGNGPPTRWELFLKRITTWIREVLDRIFAFAALHPSGSTILFWVVITGAVGIIGSWLLRLWTRANQTLALAVPEPAAKIRTWEEWVYASRVAADRGDAREAIHLAYWAGVMRLQEVGALPPNATLTPRESLRFLSGPRPSSMPVPVAFQESFSGLTSGLERFWYARRRAAPEDFSESLRHLEALGCRVD